MLLCPVEEFHLSTINTCRYVHSDSETIDASDMENGVKCLPDFRGKYKYLAYID